MAHPTEAQTEYLRGVDIVTPDTKEHATRLIRYIKEGIPSCRMTWQESESDRIGRVISVQNKCVDKKVLVAEDFHSALSYQTAIKLQGDEVVGKYVYTIPTHFGWDWPFQNPLVVRVKYEDEESGVKNCGIPVPNLNLEKTQV